MTGVFDKMREWFMPSDDDYDEEYETVEESVVDVTPIHSQRKRSFQSGVQETKVLNIHKNTKIDIMSLTISKFDDTAEVSAYIKQRKPVVLNMQKLDRYDAQRVLDYLSGATYALDGEVEKIAENIFLFSPEHVNVSTALEEVRQRNSFVL